jgi:hypothetical protein
LDRDDLFSALSLQSRYYPGKIVAAAAAAAAAAAGLRNTSGEKGKYLVNLCAVCTVFLFNLNLSFFGPHIFAR